MEISPQQIDAARLKTEIDRQVRGEFAFGMNVNALEKRALKKYPPMFRETVGVSPALRRALVDIAKSRQPKIKKHVLL